MNDNGDEKEKEKNLGRIEFSGKESSRLYSFLLLALYLLIYHQLISSTAETLVPKQLATHSQSKYPVHTT